MEQGLPCNVAEHVNIEATGSQFRRAENRWLLRDLAASSPLADTRQESAELTIRTSTYFSLHLILSRRLDSTIVHSEVHMAASNHANASFLSLLPTEIRLRIYSEVLRFDHPITKCRVKPRQQNDALPYVNEHFGLLFVNKQIAREALSVLYEVGADTTRMQPVIQLTQKLSL